MKKSARGLIFVALFLYLYAAIPARAFDFGGGPARNPSVEILLKGETARPEGKPGTVSLETKFRNKTDERLHGEIRVVLMAINDQIDFDKVVVTELKQDGTRGDHTGFFAEERELAPGEQFDRNFRIALPPEARGKNLQVMVLYYRFRDGMPPEMSKEVYVLADR